jgi:hypothetical protein
VAALFIAHVKVGITGHFLDWDNLYCRKLRRRSLTDAMVAMGFLVIRKRMIPLPIKTHYEAKGLARGTL